jgi:type II secretion system protein I
MKARPLFSKGFVLLEALLAVAIFALGVLALGRCVSNCVAAERLKSEDALARRALENRMAEIEAGVVSSSETRAEDLSGPCQGFRLVQSNVPLERRNERDQPLAGISVVTLAVSWQGAGETHQRTQIFYASPVRP